MTNSFHLQIVVPKDLRESREAEYVAALLEEFRVAATLRQWVGRTISGIWFQNRGTGLSGPALQRFLVGLAEQGVDVANRPIVYAVPPAAIGRSEVTSLVRSGLSAVQIELQSLDDATLQTLESPYSAADISSAVRTWQLERQCAVGARFVYGVPSQSVEQFRSDLARLIVLQPAFVAYRPLVLVAGSAVDRNYRSWWRRHHLIKMPMMLRMRGIVQAVMSGLQLEEQELHQFAAHGEHEKFFPPGPLGDALGLGIGAETRYCDISGKRIRTDNDPVVEPYLHRILVSGSAVVTQQVLSRTEQVLEYIEARFRLRETISVGDLEFRFGVRLDGENSGVLEVLREGGYLEQAGDNLLLTDLGTVAFEDVVSQMGSAE